MTTPNIDVIREVGFQMSREYGNMLMVIHAADGSPSKKEMMIPVQQMCSLIGIMMSEVGPDPRSKEEQALDSEGLNDKEQGIADFFYVMSGVRASDQDKMHIKEVAAVDVPLHTILAMMERCYYGYRSLHKNQKIRVFSYYRYVVTLFLEARNGIKNSGPVVDEDVPVDEQEYWREEAIFISPDWKKKSN
ncbi:hypothetical protein E4V51_13590 [Paenibacillus sp. 28ISP30-2]|nr:hypothetical protein [Paenibacillus sp. 28ISP30-2]